MSSRPTPDVDPRGLRFAAVVSAVVLAAVLVTGSATLLAAQALVFAIGAGLGLRWSPYGLLFRRFVRPRLGPPAELEPETPPRFAQAVGLVFALVGVLGAVAGIDLVFLGATAAAFVAAFLNAAFGLCLGCEMYLTYRRVLRAGATRTTRTPEGVNAV